MMVKILIGIVLVVGAFLLYVALQPSDYSVAREITIDAPAEKIFRYINTRTLANSWNPWLRKDPQARLATSGPEVGVGSVTSWSGGKQLGKGSATVIASIPNERVDVQLEYKEPFEMSQIATYLLKPNGTQTTVVWKIEGKNNFLGRLMCAIFSMDKMVGPTFVQGLNELKGMVENAQ